MTTKVSSAEVTFCIKCQSLIHNHDPRTESVNFSSGFRADTNKIDVKLPFVYFSDIFKKLQGGFGVKITQGRFEYTCGVENGVVKNLKVSKFCGYENHICLPVIHIVRFTEGREVTFNKVNLTKTKKTGVKG